MALDGCEQLLARALGGWNGEDGTALSDVFRVAVSTLRAPDSPSRAAENIDHVRVLAESATRLPPITVHRPTMRVIDGAHRLRAAQLRGETEIAVRYFDGPIDDAFILSVAANTRHGLPLSLAERTVAARRILGTHPQWSDRAIASVTGLSSKTVGAQRQQIGASAEVEERVGRDGRARPVNSAEGRRLAGRLIQETPGASLREVARRAGISTGTVRDVRARLSRGEDVVPLRQRGERPDAPRDRAERDRAESAAVPLRGERDRPRRRLGAQPVGFDAPDSLELFRRLCRDPSLRFSENGRQLLRLVEMHLVAPERWETVAGSVPAHRAQLVSVLAMECAQQWERLAERLGGSAAATPVA